MAISTYKVFLMKKESVGGEYKKLVDIKDFPDLGGIPDTIDTTTLSNASRTSIPGIQENENLVFTANYDPAKFSELEGLEGKEDSYAVWFGGTGMGDSLVPDGSMGKFEFGGQLSVYANGGGVNEVVNMTITIAPSTDIVFKYGD